MDLLSLGDRWIECPLLCAFAALDSDTFIYRGIFVSLIETEVSLSFFITSKIHTYYVKKQESIFITPEARQVNASPSDGRRRCRSYWKSIRRRPSPHLISSLSLLMKGIKASVKLLTKSEMKNACITMQKPVSPTISGS